MIYPFDDTYMKYNRNTHRYTLTPQAAAELCNIDLNRELDASGLPNAGNLAERFLDNVSMQIYQYIYSFAYNVFAAERDLAKQPQLRQVIQYAMQYQLMYMVANGDISSISGINFRTGQQMDLNSLQKAQIAPMAKSILQNSGICYNGFTPWFNVDYEGEGY